MPQNAVFLRTRDLLVSPKTTQRHFSFTLHPLSTVIFATATVLAFVLLRNSSFNFHCYTQREATPTQKSARKCAATSRDFLHERLQSAFTLANQLLCIAQQSDARLWSTGTEVRKIKMAMWIFRLPPSLVCFPRGLTYNFICESSYYIAVVFGLFSTRFNVQLHLWNFRLPPSLVCFLPSLSYNFNCESSYCRRLWSLFHPV